MQQILLEKYIFYIILFLLQSYIKLKFYMNLIMALLVGGLYTGVGRYASKALFNFGFIFTIVMVYLYIPMMPVLLQCK